MTITTTKLREIPYKYVSGVLGYNGTTYANGENIGGSWDYMVLVSADYDTVQVSIGNAGWTDISIGQVIRGPAGTKIADVLVRDAPLISAQITNNVKFLVGNGEVLNFLSQRGQKIVTRQDVRRAYATVGTSPGVNIGVGANQRVYLGGLRGPLPLAKSQIMARVNLLLMLDQYTTATYTGFPRFGLRVIDWNTYGPGNFNATASYTQIRGCLPERRNAFAQLATAVATCAIAPPGVDLATRALSNATLAAAPSATAVTPSINDTAGGIELISTPNYNWQMLAVWVELPNVTVAGQVFATWNMEWVEEQSE